MNILIFQVSSHTFHDLSRLFHTYDFPDLENFYFKFHEFPNFSRICTNLGHIHSIGISSSVSYNDDVSFL